MGEDWRINDLEIKWIINLNRAISSHLGGILSQIGAILSQYGAITSQFEAILTK